MIDLRRLRVLRILDEQGSVSGVAASLHLTPSAVSQQIRQLSQDVGVALLRRDGRGVALTTAARVLLDHADSLYAQWELALAEVAAVQSDGSGLLRMCGFPTALATLLAPAAALLRKSAVPVRTELTEAENAECLERLLAGHADIAIVVPTPTSPPMDDPRFDQCPLLDDPFDLIVPSGHRLTDRHGGPDLQSGAELDVGVDLDGGVDLAEASREAWIAAGPLSDNQALVRTACAAAGFTPRIAHYAEEWNAVIALVTHGFGVCLMPRLAPIPAHHGVIRIPLRGDPGPSRRVLSCVRRGSREQAGIARGLWALAEVSRELPPPLVPGDRHDDGPEEAQSPHRHTYRG
jgi:DNA-binding transcriptional LysR family regulator